jgi:hypothetical protein
MQKKIIIEFQLLKKFPVVEIGNKFINAERLKKNKVAFIFFFFTRKKIDLPKKKDI